MNKKSKLLVVVVLGFLLGLGARFAFHDPSTERVERVIFLFQELCIEPHLSDSVTVPSDYDLEAYPVANSEGRWADNESMTFILLGDDRNCRLTAPPEFSFSADQAKQLTDELEQIVNDRFPELSLDKGVEGTATFAKGWFNGQFASKARWGIYFWASSASDERLDTIMAFKKPRTD